MKHKRITTSSGRFIDIYDDVFPSYLREYHLIFAQRSKYSLGTTTSEIQWQRDKTFFQSVFSKEDLNNFKFHNDELLLKIQDYTVKNCWTIASSPMTQWYFHSDTRIQNTGNISLLYYINTRWEKNWGGETIFSNDEGECEIAVEYKPGRVVIFDSLISHKPAAIGMEADEFRFTLTIQMEPKKPQPRSSEIEGETPP